jgi:hypothetical protein
LRYLLSGRDIRACSGVDQAQAKNPPPRKRKRKTEDCKLLPCRKHEKAKLPSSSIHESKKKRKIRSQKKGEYATDEPWGPFKQKASKSNRLATESLVEREARALSPSLLSWHSPLSIFLF